MIDSLQNELFDLDSASSSPERLTRVFLNWDQPLLTASADFLLRDWEGLGPIDLSDKIVIVPTRNASRRLRETLAMRAAQQNSGVLPPIILNPDDLLSSSSSELVVATKLETLAAWIQVLREVNLSEFAHLFPVQPDTQDFSWALRAARDFMQVQSLLGEAAHNISYAAKVLANHDIESERWAELARIETLAHALLEGSGRQARSQSRRQAIDRYELPVTSLPHQQLILLGLPDPPPALEPLIKRLSQTTEVLVAIHAPEAFADSFDLLGKPTESWNLRSIQLAEDHLHAAANPAAQARWVGQEVAKYDVPQAPHYLALGVPDPAVIPPLRKELNDLGLQAFDPTGRTLANHGLYHLLQTLQNFATSQSMLLFRELLRAPGVAEAAGHHEIPEGGEAFCADRVLRHFDEFHEAHLCNTLADARAVLPHTGSRLDRAVLTRGIAWIQSWLQRLRKESPAEVLPDFLSQAYEYASADFSEQFAEVAQLFQQALAEFSETPLQAFAAEEQLQFFLILLAEQSLSENRPNDAIEFTGWLELPWEDAPHVIIAGFNEGLVPETIQGHPWLPNSARRLLGLRHNTERQARDAYLLTALIQSRQTAGQVDLLFGKTTERADPLRPSRFLLATEPADLSARVQSLFQGKSADTEPQPWTMGWQLTPPRPDDEAFQSLSVTEFSKYLDCPFRFYLSAGLRMQKPDLDRNELNARDFGNVTHQVLEDFAKTDLATSCDPEKIASTFDELLSDYIAKRYGSSLSAPLILQAESIRQRLRWWAEYEAVQRQEGWQILEVESYLAPKDKPFRIGSMPIRGMIDRIEEHSKLGLRVIDFKTKKKPEAVIEAHLKKLPAHKHCEDLPDWATLHHNGKEHRWKNLQVPLYLLALADRFPNRQLTAGYAQLGMAKNSIHLDLWEDLNEEILNSAHQCALGVVSNIQDRIFWPPNEKPKHDDFSSIFFGDPLSAVNPIHLPTEKGELA